MSKCSPNLREPIYLDMPTAARRVGFSLRHFRRLAELNHIPIMQIGRKFFVLTSDVDACLKSYKVTA